jgi:ferric-dicitrate binding protein FerR (iron transport regulator)
MYMQNDDYEEIKEAGWRRPLNKDEAAALQKFLAAHPETRQAWGEEAALNRLLERLPAPPVSSNFTSRLLLAVQAAPVRSTWRDWFAPALWLPEGRAWRVAMCSMMVGMGLFSFHEYQTIHRVRMARDLAGVSRVAALPPMEWLKDFDTINGMSQVKVADDDLLAALE